MADRGDTHYHVPTLNLWFLVSSALFLLTMVWTVIDDWNAEWKGYQRGFRELELGQAQVVQAELGAQLQEREDALLQMIVDLSAPLEDKLASARRAPWQVQEKARCTRRSGDGMGS